MEIPNDEMMIDPIVESPSETIQRMVKKFRESIPTLEQRLNLPFVLFQDGKSKAYFVDIHIASEDIGGNLDYEASLDPEDQEEYKANRNLLPFHAIFLKMQKDAKQGRQFNDIIVEYSPESDPVLKLFGGQHRSRSIEESLKDGINRYHGFRVYFGLNKNQRNEIAQVSNANISVPIDLLDRMQETIIGPELRNFCKNVGLMPKEKDFAERKNKEGLITARLARTFVVNFVEGFKSAQSNTKLTFSGFIGDEANDVYLKWNTLDRISTLKDPQLIKAGKEFAKLHRKQLDGIKSDKELAKISEFRTKALTPSIISAWSFVAGFLQDKEKRLKKFYKLREISRSSNPLSAKEMSEFKHHSDPKTYRGLGTRTDKRERGKLIELFLMYSEKEEKSITTKLIDAAVSSFMAKVLNDESEKKSARVK